jgi:hypothetical protein
MKRFYRITAYCFLALVSVTALRMYDEGWQRYAAIILFVAVTVRLMTLIFPRSAPFADKRSPED